MCFGGRKMYVQESSLILLTFLFHKFISNFAQFCIWFRHPRHLTGAEGTSGGQYVQCVHTHDKRTKVLSPLSKCYILQEKPEPRLEKHKVGAISYPSSYVSFLSILNLTFHTNVQREILNVCVKHVYQRQLNNRRYLSYLHGHWMVLPAIFTIFI